MTKHPKKLPKFAGPLLIWLVFETVAVTLWLTLGKPFYLFNFTYIGTSVALGVYLYACGIAWARRFVQFAVGSYMLVFLGLVMAENMQIEGFWYFLFSGVFAGATIHYLVAKIAGPAIFGRGWCGYACWTAMILDLLPYKQPRSPRKPWGALRYVILLLSLPLPLWLYLAQRPDADQIMLIAFIVGNLAYYVIGIALAFTLKDNRAFCKYFCPIAPMMKPAAKLARLRIHLDQDQCINCSKCLRVCPMDVDILGCNPERERATECILCLSCVSCCPKKALHL